MKINATIYSDRDDVELTFDDKSHTVISKEDFITYVKGGK